MEVFGEVSKPKELVIAYDTREQTPVHDLDGTEISKGVVVRYVRRPLYVFDYACELGLTPTDGKLMIPSFACERKGLGDLVSSLFNGENYKRELAKIDKAKRLWGNSGLPVCYVVEADMEMIGKYDYSRFPSGRVTAKAVVSKINQLRYEKNVHFILARSRIQAEYTIISIMKKHWMRERFKKAVSSKGESK